MNLESSDREQHAAASILSPSGGALRTLLDSLRAIGQEGRSYSQNEYDTARYKKLLELANQQYALISGIPTEEVREMFLKEQGSITPKVGVDAAVINDKSEILVLKRSDGTWGIPGGWADVDESPFQTAKRETFEETGLVVGPIGYISIASKTPLTHPGWVSQVNVCVAVQPISSDKEIILSNEHTDYKWINDVEQINNWHTGHKQLFPRIFSAYRDQSFIPDVRSH